MNRPSRLRLVLVGCVLVGAGAGTVAPESIAATQRKMFHESLSISPAGPLVVGTAYTFTFTLTNDQKSQTPFGSALILVPSGYLVTPGTAVPGNFTEAPAQGGILVTNNGPTTSGIAPKDSLTVAITVTPTAASCDGTWTTFVKQSNDFSGSGNEFQAIDPAPQTSTGSDSLTFSTDPDGTTEYDTPMPTSPVVEIVDPCNHVVTLANNTTVALTDSQHVLNALGSSVTVSAGSPAIFTFSNVTFSAFGINDDTLTASSSPLANTTSTPFDIVQKLVSCADGQTCTTGDLVDDPNNTTTIANITAFTGGKDTLTATVKGTPNADQFPNCAASGEPFYGSIVTFNVTTRGKQVTMTLPKAYVNAISNNGTPFMDICLSLDSGTFVDKFGHSVSNGLLQDCSATIPADTPPCITSRGKHAANEVITFVLPAGDPRASWG